LRYVIDPDKLAHFEHYARVWMRLIEQDPECAAITHHYEQTNCFTKYERTFMRPVLKG